MALAMVGSSLPANVGLSGLFDGFSLTAGAEEISGTYWQTEWDESTQTVTGSSAAIPEDAREFTGRFDYIENDPDDLEPETLWYVVDKDTTVNERLTVRRHKTVNLVIKDGVTLTCNKGIEVARRDGENDSDYYGGILNIYGESETGGKLVAKADENYAGIGGHSEYFCGKINIYSGEVEATGGKYGAGIGTGAYATVGWKGFVNIYGGKVKATGGESGAGIGCGICSLNQYVSIYGGTIDALGGKNGAGIGLGELCYKNGHGEINIYGGTITSSGGYQGAGIGGGYRSSGRNLHIYGGDVTANAGEMASGIGAGNDESEFNITIDGGKVKASGNKGGAGIGGGYSKNATGTIVINGGEIEASGGYIESTYNLAYAGAGIGSGSYHDSLTYTADFEGEITITGGTINVKGGNQYNPSNEISGGGAAIGSGCGTNMQGTVNISGGTLIAEGLSGGAAIGAGREAGGINHGGECEGTVNITGGNLTLSAGDGAAAIGHGKDGSDDGTLHIDGMIAVTKGDETTPVSYLDRGKETRSNTKVHIYPCEHDASGKTYTINVDNGQTHTYFCSYCGHSDIENHNMSNGICIECGYGSDKCTVIFKCDVETLYTYQIAVNKMVTMPELPATKNNGNGSFTRYYGWHDEADTIHPNEFSLPGSGATVIADTTYTALSETVWQVTVDDNIKNGEVRILKPKDGYERADETVVVRVTPDTHYKLKAVYMNGTELTYTNETGDYPFYMPDGSAAVSAEFDYADGIGTTLAGYSLSLDGDIGVNFYMELDDSVVADADAYMQFTLPNDTTQTVKVNDAILDTTTVSGKTYYVFKCNVAAKDMASQITAQMFYGDKKGTEYKYSVKDYAYYLLVHNEVEEYAKAAPLVKAMLNYGAYAQEYFGEGTPLADSYKAAVDSVSVPDDFKYNNTNTTLPTGVTFEGATLSLKSETTLSLYFTGLPDNTTFTCGDKEVKTEKNGSYVVARIRGIKAEELENDFTLTFTGGSVTYNPMTYCYNVLNGGTTNDALKNVCRALYKFAEAAKPNS